MALGTTKIRDSDVATTKLGYANYVVCPHCGFRFGSRLQQPRS